MTITIAVEVMIDCLESITNIKEDTTIILRTTMGLIMMIICQRTQVLNKDGFRTVKKKIKDSGGKSSGIKRDNRSSVMLSIRESCGRSRKERRKSRDKRNKSNIMTITIIKSPQEMTWTSILTMI